MINHRIAEMRHFTAYLALLLPLSTPVAGGGKCGTTLYEACTLGAVDPRYNPAVSFNLSASHPLYDEWSGYWIGIYESFAPDGQPRQPSPFDPVTKRGLPYALNKPFLGFANKTVDGTRLYWHIAVIYDPADVSFCESDLPEGLTNVIGNGTCGINGHAAAVDILDQHIRERWHRRHILVDQRSGDWSGHSGQFLRQTGE